MAVVNTSLLQYGNNYSRKKFAPGVTFLSINIDYYDAGSFTVAKSFIVQVRGFFSFCQFFLNLWPSFVKIYQRKPVFKQETGL